MRIDLRGELALKGARACAFFKNIGSQTLTIGGGCAKLQELSGPVVSIAYKLSWEREYLDLKELARLRWIEHWKIERLADYFAVSPTAIKERLRNLKERPIDIGIPISSKIIRGS